MKAHSDPSGNILHLKACFSVSNEAPKYVENIVLAAGQDRIGHESSSCHRTDPICTSRYLFQTITMLLVLIYGIDDPSIRFVKEIALLSRLVPLKSFETVRRCDRECVVSHNRCSLHMMHPLPTRLVKLSSLTELKSDRIISTAGQEGRARFCTACAHWQWCAIDGRLPSNETVADK